MGYEMRLAVLGSEDCLSLCGRQAGLLHRDQLFLLGMTRAQVAIALRSRRIRRVLPRVYEVVRDEHRYLQLLRAATMRLPRAVVSHRSAGIVHGLDGIGAAAIELTQNNVWHASGRGLVLRRTRHLPEADVQLIDGMPVTTLIRTLLDLAAVLDEESLAYAVDHARRTGRTSLEELEARLAQERRPGVDGISKMARVLRDARRRGRPMDSALEVRWWRLARKERLPRQLIQVAFEHRGLRGRLDFLMPKCGLVIETRGAQTHSEEGDFERDSLRTLHIAALGYEVIAITWQMLERDAAAVIVLVRDIIERRLQSGADARRHPTRSSPLALTA